MEIGEDKVEKVLIRLTWVICLIAVIQFAGLNFFNHGLNEVIRWVMVVFAFGLGCGYLFILIKKLARRVAVSGNRDEEKTKRFQGGFFVEKDNKGGINGRRIES